MVKLKDVAIFEFAIGEIGASPETLGGEFRMIKNPDKVSI